MSYTGEFVGTNTAGGRDRPIAGYASPHRRETGVGSTPLIKKTDAENLAVGNVPSIMAIFGRIGFGYLVLDERMKVTEWNEPARVALEVDVGVSDKTKAISDAFKQLTSPVACKFSPGTVSWVVIPYRGGTPVIVHDDAVIGSQRTSVVMLVTRETSPQPNPVRLQQMYGLTSAEVQLATSLACGSTPLEIARRRKLSRTTIRSQLAALFSKTETKRQSELVALLGHVAVLP
jgi:DNA-binding CsgD family transcriptional regulator